MLIFLDPRGVFGREMFVISASVDAENSAKRLNAVLKTKLMNSV